MRSRIGKTLLIVTAVLGYFAVDIAMDVLLFPRLPEVLKEHHRTVVTGHAVFFGLLPVWIVGVIVFEKRQNRIPVLVFGSALAATVVFAFTSLPFIWVASAVPSLAPPLLFLHDYGLYVYFGLLVSIFGLRQVTRQEGSHRSKEADGRSEGGGPVSGAPKA